MTALLLTDRASSQPVLDPGGVIDVACTGETASGALLSSAFVSVTGSFDLGSAEMVLSRLEELTTDPACPGNGPYLSRFVLKLHSAGGSFLEAIRLGHEVRRRGIGTYVDDGAICLSACALVFMSGTQHLGDGDTAPLRTLHYRGKLGFHAPYVDLKSFAGVPDEALRSFLVQSYQTAISAASELTILAIEGRWRASLVRQMLETSANDFLIIDTVNEAGRWGIQVAGIPEAQIDDENLLRVACINFHLWDADAFSGEAISRSGAPLPADLELQKSLFEQWLGDNMNSRIEKETADLGVSLVFDTEMGDGPNCTFYRDASGRIRETAGFARSEVWRDMFRSYYSVPGYMTLDEAHSRIVALAERSRGAHRSSPSLFFRHNGSRMKLDLKPNPFGGYQAKIVYDEPKPGLSKIGIRSGTILFEGDVVGRRLEGRARIFSSKCGTIEYQVSGDAPDVESGAGFHLRGSAPKRNNSCQTTAWTTEGGNANLYFEPL